MCACRTDNRCMIFLAWAAFFTATFIFPSPPAYAADKAVRIGVLTVAINEQSEEAAAFKQALRDLGYIEGPDMVIDWWFGQGRYDLVQGAAGDMVRRKPDVIVVESTPAALAVKQATSTIPIVLALVSDPVGSGLVASLAHPGGNVTGLSNQTVDLAAKRLQLLKEAIPDARRVAVVFNPETPPNRVIVGRLKDASPGIGVNLKFITVRTTQEIRSALEKLNRSNTDALF